MKLVGKVPVEPLDDERLTNIERKLVVQVSELPHHAAPLRAPRRMLAVAALAMAVVVAGFVGWKLHGVGGPIVASRPSPTEPAIAMTAGALDLGDAQIRGTDFTVRRSAGRTEIDMKPGTLELHVEHEPGRLFVVKAGAVEIEDVGTRFSVDYDGSHVGVRVTEGEVKVKHAGKEVSVTAGNAWTIEDGAIAIAQLDAIHRAPETEATAQASAPEAGTVVAAAPTARNGSAQGSTDGSGQGSSGTGGGSRPRKIGGPDAKRALANWDDQPRVATTETDPGKAILGYLAQIKNMPEGERKVDLLQSIAVMHLRAKNYADARRMVEGILHERQAAGPWSEWPAYKSALWLDVRAKCLLARTRGPTFDDACRLASNKYIARFPTGAPAGVAQQVLNEI